MEKIVSGVISAFKNERNHIVLDTPGAVAVLPFLDPLSHPNPRLLLVKQYRSAVHQDVIEIVAGMLDVNGEDPINCASRELTEETGYTTEDIYHINTVLSSPGISTEKIHIFLATNLSKTSEPEPGIEIIESTLSECLNSIYQDYNSFYQDYSHEESKCVINDSKTIIAILAFAQFYHKIFIKKACLEI